MKEKLKKIGGSIIILAGLMHVMNGIEERMYARSLVGIGFVIMGSLYFYEKRNEE